MLYSQLDQQQLGQGFSPLAPPPHVFTTWKQSLAYSTQQHSVIPTTKAMFSQTWSQTVPPLFSFIDIYLCVCVCVCARVHVRVYYKVQYFLWPRVIKIVHGKSYTISSRLYSEAALPILFIFPIAIPIAKSCRAKLLNLMILIKKSSFFQTLTFSS